MDAVERLVEVSNALEDLGTFDRLQEFFLEAGGNARKFLDQLRMDRRVCGLPDLVGLFGIDPKVFRIWSEEEFEPKPNEIDLLGLLQTERFGNFQEGSELD